MTIHEQMSKALEYCPKNLPTEYAKGYIDGFIKCVELMEVKFEDIPPPKDQGVSE